MPLRQMGGGGDRKRAELSPEVRADLHETMILSTCFKNELIMFIKITILKAWTELLEPLAKQCMFLYSDDGKVTQVGPG